jgi:hypothetical protein
MNFDRLPIIFSIVTCRSQAFEDVLHSMLEIWLGHYLEMWMIYLLYHVSQVKTTSPKKYCVRPNTGIVLPQSSADVTGIPAWQLFNGSGSHTMFLDWVTWFTNMIYHLLGDQLSGLQIIAQCKLPSMCEPKLMLPSFSHGEGNSK